MPISVVDAVRAALLFVGADPARLETDRVRKTAILAYRPATNVRIFRDPGAVLGRVIFLVPVAVDAVRVALLVGVRAAVVGRTGSARVEADLEHGSLERRESDHLRRSGLTALATFQARLESCPLV